MLITGFTNAYLDTNGVYDAFQTLASGFPGLCTWVDLPFQSHGYDGSNPALAGPSPVWMMRITNTPAINSKPGLLLICGTHAREWVNPLIAIEFASQLLHNYDPASDDPDISLQINRIVEEADIFIVPVMNPDGVNYSHHDNENWRKNRRPAPGPGECSGVDNNRNFSVFFGQAGSGGTSCTGNYRGPYAFSEPETQNIRYILEAHPNILIGVDSHSQGEKIYRPNPGGGSYTASLPVYPEDEVLYTALENVAINAIQTVNGKTYLTGTTSNHAGTSDEYMFFAHRIFGFDFECALAHRPPIADGLISVQEVTAALGALSLQAIDLELTTGTPVSVVQCIDRTGSMVTLGYKDAAQDNACRFADMMSLGDEAAIVSFADPASDPDTTPLAGKSVEEYPLTPISHPGIFNELQTAIKAIDFGGWTSIGAGLQRSGELLGGAAFSRNILLISDGFENRTPSAAEVLDALPGDIRVFTIALGDNADTDLLHEIASTTGGSFHMSPSELELHEIYNEIRSNMGDDDLVMNEQIEMDDHEAQRSKSFPVEDGAKSMQLSFSWTEGDVKPEIRVFDPFGKEVAEISKKVEWIVKDKYRLLRIQRPKPGEWRICIRNHKGKMILGAFVTSSMKLDLTNYRIEKRKLYLSPHLKVNGVSFPIVSGKAQLIQQQSSTELSRNASRALQNAQVEASAKQSISFQPLSEFKPQVLSLETGIGMQDCPKLRVPNIIRSRDFEVSLEKQGIHVFRGIVEGVTPWGRKFQRSFRKTIYQPAPLKKGMYRVHGTIIFESMKPTTHLVIEVIDKDAFRDDRIGSVLPKKDGRFELCFDKSAFGEKAPDLYLRVLNSKGQVVWTSEKSIRKDAGTEEYFEVKV